MDKTIKTKLLNTLKSEADYIQKHEDPKSKEFAEKLNTILCMLQIIENFDDLEPTLQKYFEEKRYRDKWER